MRLKNALRIFCFLSFVFWVLPSDIGQTAQTEFIYDSLGKRDPLVPLINEESPSGLRTKFLPPEQDVRLPLEIAVKGILWNGREYFAIINNEVLQKGDNLGEVRIKRIDQDKVVLEYREKEFTLFLKKKE
jgi:type II secretory pathway component PulC